MSALIGALRVSLSADTASFEQGMARARKSAATNANAIQSAFSGVKTAIGGLVGALSIGAVVAAGKAALEYAGHLGELAETLGLTTKDLQEFSYAAGQVGISQDQLETGIQKLTISMGQAEVGAEKQAKAFKAVGISVDDLKGKNAGDVFRLIADKLKDVTDRSQRAAVEVALFGKSGAKLDNLLSGAEGSLDQLSSAAEKLGIVLSEEQIRNADRTADKLAALQTVLKANIAGAVADNAEGIYELVAALSKLVGIIPKAIQGWSLFLQMGGSAFGAIRMGQNPLAAIRGVTAQNNNNALGARFAGDRAAMTLSKSAGINIPKFLGSGGGGGGGHKADHSAEDLQRKQLEALQKAYDFAQDQLRADEDILQAKKDLSSDYVEQTSLSLDILNIQREQYKAELDYKVKQNEITKGQDGINQAQADILLAKYDQADQAKRAKTLEEEESKRLEDIKMLTEADYDRKREILEKQADLADTQSERRQIELDLLKLAYDEKKQALQRIIDNSKDQAEIENARRDLAGLNANYAADRQGVMKQTAGPLESYLNSLPHTAAEINEALQSIEVEGIDGLSKALTGVITGTESLKDAFHQLALSVLQDLIEMTIKMLIFKAISAALGGGFSAGGGDLGASNAALDGMGTPGFATGGAFTIMGNTGTDKNMLSLNGLPIARVSHGERINIGNDNGPGMGRVTVVNNNDFRGADPSAVAAIRARLDRSEAELPNRVIQAVFDAKARNVIR